MHVARKKEFVHFSFWKTVEATTFLGKLEPHWCKKPGRATTFSHSPAQLPNTTVAAAIDSRIESVFDYLKRPIMFLAAAAPVFSLKKIKGKKTFSF